jgi:hypothetical protein
MKNPAEKNRPYRGLIGPMVLVLIGTVFLLLKTGVIQREMLSQFWPLVLIVVGGSLLVARIKRNSEN